MLKLITIPKGHIFSTKNPNHFIFHSKPISTTPQCSPSTHSIPLPTHQHITQLILDQKSPSEAIQTFQWASELPNFTHSQSTYRALIHKLCTFRRFDTARQLLDEMPNSIGCPPDESIFVTLVRGFGRARMIRDVIKVVELVAKFGVRPSLKIYNSILDVLVKQDIDLAREFYRKKMMENGVRGDDYTFGILMKGLCLTNRIGDGFKLLQIMKSCEIRPNAVIYNTLLHGLCRNGKVGRARSLMNEMEDPNSVSFNILISAYCNEENLVQALVLLEKSLSFGFMPDVVTVTKVLELLCNAGRVNEAVETLERVESKSGILDVVAYNTLMKGFCKLGKLKVGCRLLKEMENKGKLPNVDTYNILISSFCESGLLDSAVNMFNDMKTDGIAWNFLTFDTLIRGLCSGGRTSDAFKILERMGESKGGSRGQISPYNSILYGLYKENRLGEALEFLVQLEKLFPRAVDRSLTILDSCSQGSMEEAYRVLQHMIGEGGIPNVLVYDCLIYGFCQQGCTREAFELMNDMIGRGYFPVASTFNALIAEFCRQGKVGSAVKLLEDVEERGCKSDVGSYSSLIDAYRSIRNCQKAWTIFLQMVERGILPDHSVWNSLLLCQSQGKNWSNNENLLVIADILGSVLKT